MPNPFHVVILDDGYEDYTTEQTILSEVGAIITLKPCRNDASAVIKALSDADAALVRESPVTAEALSSAVHCRAIVRYGIGVDNIALEAAAKRKIYVANVPDYGSEEVSDQAMALLLSTARQVLWHDRNARNGVWNKPLPGKMYRIAGRTLGLVGYGRIARTFERKMRGMGIGRVLVTDPYLKPDENSSVELVDIDALCAESDYISLHAPLTAETRHIIDERVIGLMKPTAILVNTARGALIDEKALIEALKNKVITGAGLDVFEREPLPADSLLTGLDNVVLSDHTAWYSEESIHELQSKAASEVLRVLKGEKPLHWVNCWED